MVKDKTGSLRLALGTFNKGWDIKVNSTLVANPPELKDGEVALPVTLTLRNSQSPDAIRAGTAETINIVDKKPEDNKQLNRHELNAILCSSVICDMANVYLVNKNGKRAELKYSEANAVRLIKEVSSLKDQLIPILDNTGNFMELESLTG
ncbi:MAG: hypothetical protein K0U66_09755 [Gammaproteobacteria bacterium]|nr:hypothetical protein [Gammaproteobacteria bacterium]